MRTTANKFYQFLLLFLALFQLVSSMAQWYTANDGNDYLIEDEVKYNWLQANDECARRGLQLVTFDSQAKINNLETLLRTKFASTIGFYLGLHDEFNTKKDKGRPFYEASTGEKITFTNWNKGQPDNADTEEHCVHIYKEQDFKWNDVRCEYTYGFVCEENHFTTKYRKHMEGKRLETKQKNTKISSEFSDIQTEIKAIIENTKSDSNQIMTDLRESTDEIIANVKQSIKDIIMNKPYMEAVIADLNKSISEIVLENEKEFAKVSAEARQMMEEIHASGESSISEVTFKFSGKLTMNTNEIDKLLVY